MSINWTNSQVVIYSERIQELFTSDVWKLRNTPPPFCSMSILKNRTDLQMECFRRWFLMRDEIVFLKLQNKMQSELP